MVQTRRISARRADVATEADEPLLELARKKVATEGGSLRLALRALREERRERARNMALAEAPRADPQADGSYLRVSRDPRWPFGIQDDEVVAPFGLSECGLPRVIDKATNKQGPVKSNMAARKEARDIIADKLTRLGCDPIAIMAEIAMDSVKVKDEVRLRAAAELASMVYPRLRSVESVSRDEKTIFVIGIPAEQPKTADTWLAGAQGARQIAAAVEDASKAVIEGEVIKND